MQNIDVFRGLTEAIEHYDAKEQAVLKGLESPEEYQKAWSDEETDYEVGTVLIAAIRLALPLLQPSGPDEEDIPQTLRLALAAFVAARQGQYDEAAELIVGLEGRLHP